MSKKMRAVVALSNSPGDIALGSKDLPVRGQRELLIRVETISLNPGELRLPADRPALGRDFCGTVVETFDGSPIELGTRVAGVLPGGGAFAEFAAVQSDHLARVPDNVSSAAAATLPVAGLTALLAVKKFGFLLGQNVLITGATGGVGHLAVQLAKAAGAHVTAAVRSPDRQEFARENGAEKVLVGPPDNRVQGNYSRFLDTVGGPHILLWLQQLARRGTCIAVSHHADTPNDTVAPFHYVEFMQKELSLESFYLFDTFKASPPDDGLSLLLALTAKRIITPYIGAEGSWNDANGFAKMLFDRSVPGKIVLHVD